MIGVLIALLLLSGQVYASVTAGTTTSPPSGFVVSNLDPNLRSVSRNEIYDPNFIPGFKVGLSNISIDWSSGYGYAKVGYSVGPWSHQESAIPHFAMGPQCCNFVEVPHTQQFRQTGWGDYYYVRAGLTSPGVNVENFTATFGAPTSYVGLRVDLNWTVRVSLNWTNPVLFDPANEWAAIGVAVTQYVPSAQGKLVYTLVNFWMDQNSSKSLTQFPDGVSRAVSGKNLVAYHPLQLQSEGNKTVSIELSPYLSDTIRMLNLTTTAGQPPLISYVYLNVEGYNFRWNTTVWSYYLLTPSHVGPVSVWTTNLYLMVLVGVAVVAAGAFVIWSHAKRSRSVDGPGRGR